MSNLTEGRHRKRVSEVKQAARAYDSKFGKMFVHDITFDDGTKGENHTKTEQCKDFRVGLEVDFDCEIKSNGNYTNYKIKVPNQQNAGGKSFGGGGGYSLDAAKWNAASVALQGSINLAIAGKIDLSKIVDQTKRNFEIISQTVQAGSSSNNESGQNG